MKLVARIISRAKIVGIFLPINEGLPTGIYDIKEIMGEYILTRVGDSAMSEPRLSALDIRGLFDEREKAGLTKFEYNKLE